MIVDTHLHLVDRSRLSYPWIKDAPALNRDWSFADYAQSARRLGIDATLHMEVDVAPSDIDAETDVVAGLMRDDSLLKGAISSARPESEGFVAWLEAIDRSVVKGVRRVLHVVPDDVSTSALFRENIGRLGAVGLPFDICVSQRQLPLAAALADAAPDTVMILDHCGVPDIVGGDFAGWSRALTDLSRRANVHVKISGITAYGPPDWTLDTLRPYVEHAIDAFGWDRVVWGSDSPVCTLQSSLEEWVAVTHALLSGASASEKERFLSHNARRIWSI